MSPATTKKSISAALHNLAAEMLDAEQRFGRQLRAIHPSQRISALNLLHYLLLRSQDIRDLQDQLHEAGLSSLASSESHALRQVQAILEVLGEKVPKRQLSEGSFSLTRKLVESRRQRLFGHTPHAAVPHIMVTFDTDFADNYLKVKTLLLAGMNVARINCAHDDPDTWARMIAHVRRASEVTGKPCKVYMDLAGPKIRTAILGKGREKGRVKLKPGQRFLLADEGDIFPKNRTVVGCTQPGIVQQLHAGERVLFDDGLFEARVVKVDGDTAHLRMVRISTEKPKLKAEKGINFPDTDLVVDALTPEDMANLPFIAEHADMVGYSFVSTPEDLEKLQHLLYGKRGELQGPAIIVKIETTKAVQNLPALLLQAMQHADYGLMIARGDLAVEIGFERLSEIQEEILWICEAAHTPVIWATQVLETMNKTGIATRSEITDAAHAAMAECVMINKGAFTLDVIETLRDILTRTGGHRLKKRYTMRPLSIARRFMDKL